MSSPVQVFLVYFKISELVRGLAGLNAFPSVQNVRDIIFNSFNLYDLESNNVVGEFTYSNLEIGSIVPGVINILSQAQFNIFDQLIIPNATSGAIRINGTINRPVKHITQDWFGRKVVIQHIDSEDPDKEVFQISVYAEEL